MGIRDKTYFERQLLFQTSPSDYVTDGQSTYVKNVFSDLSGNFYSLEEVAGVSSNSNGYVVRKSNDNGQTWSRVRTVFVQTGSFASHPLDGLVVFGGDCDSSGSLYVAYRVKVFNSNSRGNILVDKSTDQGANWSTVLNNDGAAFGSTSSLPSPPPRTSFDISRFSSNKDDIGFVGSNGQTAGGSVIYFYSRNKGQTWLSSSTQLVNILQGAVSSPIWRFYNNSFYIAGGKVGLSPQLAIIVSGSVSGTAAYFTASSAYQESFSFSNNTYGGHGFSSFEVNSVDNKMYAIEFSATVGGNRGNALAILTSSDGINFSKMNGVTLISPGSTTFPVSLTLLSLNVFNQPIFNYFTGTQFVSDYIPSGTNVIPWSLGELAYLAPIRSNVLKTGGPFNLSQSFLIEQSTNLSKVYLLSVNANSSSLGPISLATSFAFVPPNSPPGKPNIAYKLNNISEYSHGGGHFQMKNVILGTATTGKIGTSDDSIVQIRHIGSVVKVMWPKQDSINTPIKGFGDFSAGERPGKLTNQFQPGDEIDVTEFDHVCLYGYLSKIVSGSVDDVVITVERKPLTNAAYTIEQSVDYSVSGSIAEARLRNLEYRKEIDYGDLSIKNIGFPIDVPLVNTKMLRVSVKHRNGQTADENKNFILWGRFIKSSKDTNET